MKHFYDPADWPIHPPQEDDLNEPYLDESDLPTDSFEPADSSTTPNTNVQDGSNNGEASNSNAVTSLDQNTDPDVYAAERIINSRRRQGKLQYLVKWTNYPVSQSNWEPEENILDQRLLDQFHNNNE